MAKGDDTPQRVRWARLRFQIIGSLLAAPADDGELKSRLDELAARPWRHPTTDETIHFSFKTIERWGSMPRAARTIPSPLSLGKSPATPARSPACQAHSDKPSQNSTPSIRDGAFNFTTTTSSPSSARIQSSVRCLDIRVFAAI